MCLMEFQDSLSHKQLVVVAFRRILLKIVVSYWHKALNDGVPQQVQSLSYP